LERFDVLNVTTTGKIYDPSLAIFSIFTP